MPPTRQARSSGPAASPCAEPDQHQTNGRGRLGPCDFDSTTGNPVQEGRPGSRSEMGPDENAHQGSDESRCGAEQHRSCLGLAVRSGTKCAQQNHDRRECDPRGYSVRKGEPWHGEDECKRRRNRSKSTQEDSQHLWALRATDAATGGLRTGCRLWFASPCSTPVSVTPLVAGSILTPHRDHGQSESG